jgi:hypothetical protein
MCNVMQQDTRKARMCPLHAQSHDHCVPQGKVGNFRVDTRQFPLTVVARLSG